MSTDAIKDAETRGYARGYVAGRKRKTVDINIDRERVRRFNAEQAFRQRAFLASLTALITGPAWTMDGKPADDLEKRVELAKRFADASVRKFFG